MTKDYFLELAGYNVWATDIFCDMLDKISDAQWTQKVASSFNTLQETTLHIISAEKAWLNRFEKKPVEWLQFTWQGSKAEHIELWKKVSADLENFIAGFDENDLQTILHYKRLNGEEKSTPFYIMFAHVFNHSTYHRGQLVTMLRKVGYYEVKGTDLIVFYK